MQIRRHWERPSASDEQFVACAKSRLAPAQPLGQIFIMTDTPRSRTAVAARVRAQPGPAAGGARLGDVAYDRHRVDGRCREGALCHRMALVENYLGASCARAVLTHSSSFGNLAVALGGPGLAVAVVRPDGQCVARKSRDPRDFVNGMGRNALHVAGQGKAAAWLGGGGRLVHPNA